METMSVVSNHGQYFNNKNLSDCQLVFTKSNRILFLHKFILVPSSDFFRACFEHDMIESREGIVRIYPEDNEKLVTKLIKSLYTDQLSIEDQKDIVPMILLAQKFQLNALLDVLIKHLIKNINCSNILQCLQLDLEQDQFKEVKQMMNQQLYALSDEILKEDSYSTLNVEQLMCALEMLVHKDNALDAFYAVQSWIEVDVENRAQYCYALNSAIKKAVYGPEYIKSSETLFIPFYTGSRAALSQDYKRIKKIGKTGFNCGALGTKCDSFSVRLIKNCTNLMIGMAPRTINKDGKNCNSCGWYLCCENGCLYSQRGYGKSFYNKPYYNQSIDQDGVVIGVSLQDGEVSYSINDQDLGVAFRGVKGIDLHPAFDVYDSGCEFEFL